MAEASFKGKLSSHVGEFMAALLLIQPLLDVLSYFMLAAGSTVVTTSLRMAMLGAVSLYGFLISDRKQLYGALYGAVAGFWLLHMLNCFRVGYADPVGDAAEYLKLVQFPLWTASFLTFFRKREGLDLQVVGVLAMNFAIILLVIGLSYLTGTPAYTYDFPEREIKIGVLGWFGVPNAQSAVLCLLAPGCLLWALRTENLWVFSAGSLLTLGLLYLTGTKLTFYTAVIAAAVFVALILLTRRPLRFCLPLLAALVLLAVFRGASPMAQRQKVASDSYSVYQERIDRVMGEDKGYVYTGEGEIPGPVLEKIKTVYVDVYGSEGVYGETLLGGMIQRFGLDRVLEEYEYTLRPQELNHTREKKLRVMGMLWEDKDFLSRLLGMEYAAASIEGKNYDPENDFPALFYFTGYLGTALYGGFVLWIVISAALAFFRRFPALLTAEFGAAALTFALALGAALFSGQALRKPNVTVYFSLAAASLVFQAENARPARQLQPGHKRNPAVEVKKI